MYQESATSDTPPVFFQTSSGVYYFYTQEMQISIQLRLFSYTGFNVSLTLEKVVPIQHSYKADSKVASTGNNEGAVTYLGQQYWFKFTGKKDTFYTIETITTADMNTLFFDHEGNHFYPRASNEKSGIITVDNPIYILLFSTAEISTQSFTLKITQDTIPQTTNWDIYSENFKQGDYLHWTVSTSDTYGMIPPGYWLSNGNHIDITMLEDQPRITPFHNILDFFNIQSETEIYSNDLVNQFILPVERISTGNVLMGKEQILREWWSGYQVDQSNGEFIVHQASEDDTSSSSQMLVYNATNMFLKQMTQHYEYDGHQVSIDIKLTKSHISGVLGDTKNTNRVTDEKPPLSIPLNSISMITALIILPMILRYKRIHQS